MSTTIQPPRTAIDAPMPTRSSKARYAYPAVLLVYLLAFGPGALSYTVLLLYTYRCFPRSWAQAVVDGGASADIDAPLVAWVIALAISAALIIRRPVVLGGERSHLLRAAALTAVVALAVPAAWAWNHTQLLYGADLGWRILQLVGFLALAAASAAALGGPDRAESGLGRRSPRNVAQFHEAARSSLAGLVGATALAIAIVDIFHPRALAGPVGAGSGIVEPWWFWALAFAVNAIVEEGVCTAWLFALLHRAGRPRYEVYALAAVCRVAFHFYMGFPGIGAAVFALVNIRVFERTRRLMPLILTHTLFDVAGSAGDPTVTAVLTIAGAAVLLLPTGTASWLRRAFTGGLPEMADFSAFGDVGGPNGGRVPDPRPGTTSPGPASLPAATNPSVPLVPADGSGGCSELAARLVGPADTAQTSPALRTDHELTRDSPE